MNHFRATLLLLLSLLSLLAACGGEATAPQTLQVTFSHGLDETMQPIEPGAEFAPTEPVQLSAKLTNRPRSGTLTANFYWGDSLITKAQLDLSQAGKDTIVITEEGTFVGFTLAHEQPLPISEDYHTEIDYDGRVLGSYPFTVVPPPGAIPSNIRQVTLALGVDEAYNPQEPTTVFGPEETVHLVGRGDMGQLSWLRVEWYVGGELDEAGTRVSTIEEDIAEAGFYFAHQPEAGWPPGEHLAVLSLNDQTIGRYPFAIIPVPEAAPLEEEAFWQAFPLPDDAEFLPVVEGVDAGFSTTFLPPSRILDFYGAWLRLQGWERVPTTEQAPYPHRQWQKEGAQLLIEIQGQDEAGRTIVLAQFEGA